MAKSIMIQGTASNAGKSVIAAGLCRIFKQDGYKVAPFKSQNMALNSFITKAGLEMGRAQVVQAEASGIEPDVDMNPVLLKPTGDSKSQVIVHGKIWNELSARDYYNFKQHLIPKITESYRRLAGKFDIIVLEGAGSPAEINLRDNDIVNMFMARLASAPVLLAADIDRGGVFASLAGTMLLFTEDERSYVKGLIINKFRGDNSLLDSGLRQLEDITKKPILGVIPYFHLDIDDEDSQSERLENIFSGGVVKIAVVRLPRMSNYTDFNVFGASVKYCSTAKDLKDAGLIIIPGTKNTMGDLAWMRKNGIEDAVKKSAAEGKPVFGICGGYQMLGVSIADPFNVEGGGDIDGMGLLPVETVFETEKHMTRVSGRFLTLNGIFKDLSGKEIEGYEVHMGTTKPACGLKMCNPLALITDSVSGAESIDGAYSGTVYGSYIHGIFDAENISTLIVNALYREAGIEYNGANEISAKQHKENQYDMLANILRDSIDLDRIYKILNAGI
ncbi:MAG: cobyric acid synthase [Treponema sp.]|jgi:adenosylcobyric acid synthase|nr:cobyric acid synthase [Treponema sp.]